MANIVSVIKKMSFMLVLAATTLFAGCSEAQETQASSVKGETGVTTEISQKDMLVPRITVTDEKGLLNSSQADVLKEYAKVYMESLVQLKAGDISGLYHDTQSEKYHINNTALQVITTVRSMSDTDLTLENYSINYTVESVEQKGDRVVVKLLEDNSQKFRFLEQPSYSYILPHTFVMEQSGDKWYIYSHSQDEDFYLMTEETWERFSGTPQEISQKVLDAIIADAEENIQWKNENYLNKTEEKTASDTSYDRAAAVEYSKQWAGQRNYTGVYLAYDDYGGNCQNFASQCLYAGGLKMDHKGYSSLQWKFYSKTLNESATAQGRSYSWTGVEPFYNYCRDNTGGGIVANTDWGTAYTQKGDVIQVGAMSQWRHSLFVTDVITDENGYAKEIIASSNTADRLNYPLSAYIYTAPRLIHIVGQNI